MKIKTEFYGVFYKRNGKWTKFPAHGELHTKNDIIYNSELENEHAPFEEHLKNYLKMLRKHFKQPVKLLKQVWEG